MNSCRKMYRPDDPTAVEYHDKEWCKPCHDDRAMFELLCLEGASVGLSWAAILHKRESYRKAFHGFDIDRCAAMSDAELELALANPGIVRNKSKVLSVRKNAQSVKRIQSEFGSFDAYAWGFSGVKTIDGHWKTPQSIPTVSPVSIAMSKDMKKRGMSFVGPTITYSFLQSVGIVNDHLAGCPWR